MAFCVGRNEMVSGFPHTVAGIGSSSLFLGRVVFHRVNRPHIVIHRLMSIWVVSTLVFGSCA